MYTISLCASECFMGFAPSASTPSTAGRPQPALQVQDPAAVVRPSAGDGFLEPRAYAGRCFGDPRLARHRVRGDRSLIAAVAFVSAIGDSHMTETLAEKTCTLCRGAIKRQCAAIMYFTKQVRHLVDRSHRDRRDIPSEASGGPEVATFHPSDPAYESRVRASFARQGLHAYALGLVGERGTRAGGNCPDAGFSGIAATRLRARGRSRGHRGLRCLLRCAQPHAARGPGAHDGVQN